MKAVADAAAFIYVLSRAVDDQDYSRYKHR